MFFVYILYSTESDRYYVGYSENVDRRLLDHNQGERSNQSTKYTFKHRPWKLKLSLPFEERSTAMKVEKYIKRQKSRRFIEELITTSMDGIKLVELIKAQVSPN